MIPLKDVGWQCLPSVNTVWLITDARMECTWLPAGTLREEWGGGRGRGGASAACGRGSGLGSAWTWEVLEQGRGGTCFKPRQLICWDFLYFPFSGSFGNHIPWVINSCLGLVVEHGFLCRLFSFPDGSLVFKSFGPRDKKCHVVSVGHL